MILKNGNATHHNLTSQQLKRCIGYTSTTKTDGHGDEKLLAALGAWFGWQSLSTIVLIASLVAIGVALSNSAYHRRAARIPFGTRSGNWWSMVVIFRLSWSYPSKG